MLTKVKVKVIEDLRQVLMIDGWSGNGPHLLTKESQSLFASSLNILGEYTSEYEYQYLASAPPLEIA